MAETEFEKCPFPKLYDEKIRNTHKRIDDHEKRITDLEDKTADMDKGYAVCIERITASMERLETLPQAINSITATNKEIQESMISMRAEIANNSKRTEELEKTIEDISDDVREIDDQGKLNIRLFLKNNFPSIVTIILIGGAIVTKITGLW